MCVPSVCIIRTLRSSKEQICLFQKFIVSFGACLAALYGGSEVVVLFALTVEDVTVEVVSPKLRRFNFFTDNLSRAARCYINLASRVHLVVLERLAKEAAKTSMTLADRLTAAFYVVTLTLVHDCH